MVTQIVLNVTGRKHLLPARFRARSDNRGLLIALGSPDQRSLCGCQAGDRDAERRAGDVVQADRMAKLDALRLAAMLAADAQLYVGAHLLGQGDRHLHQVTHALLVDGVERAGRQDLLLDVGQQELAGVVAAEAKRHLRKVVCAEAEERRVAIDSQAACSTLGSISENRMFKCLSSWICVSTSASVS